MGTALVTASRVATVVSGKELAGDTEFTTIQAAITYAATQGPSAAQPWDVYIHPGVYTESVTCSSWVNLRGIGPRGSVVIFQANATIITLADNVEVQNLTVRLTGDVTARHLIRDSAAASTCRLIDVVIEITDPSTFAHIVFAITGSGTKTIERCSYNIGGTGAIQGVAQGNIVGVVHLIDNDFEFSNANAFHIRSYIANTWVCKGNRWAGTCAMFNIAAGTLTFDNCALLATAAWTNTESTMTLRHCAIEAPVVAGNLATVRLEDCSYRAIARTGTGNIVDESARLRDAPWKVAKWTWQALLANAQVALRGTPVDAGTGQVMLEVTDSGADFEAVEQPADAAGALDSSFTPARTPRFVTQISVDSFDAHVTMFFGLRETLGNAVPGATEDHAGFIWDGTNFKASSDDGVATQVTDLTEPGTGAKRQLEVVVFGGVTTVGRVYFYVDGVLVATHVTRIPVNVLDWQHLLATAGAGGGDVIQVTVENGGCQECPA